MFSWTLLHPLEKSQWDRLTQWYVPFQFSLALPNGSCNSWAVPTAHPGHDLTLPSLHECQLSVELRGCTYPSGFSAPISNCLMSSEASRGRVKGEDENTESSCILKWGYNCCMGIIWGVCCLPESAHPISIRCGKQHVGEELCVKCLAAVLCEEEEEGSVSSCFVSASAVTQLRQASTSQPC